MYTVNLTSYNEKCLRTWEMPASHDSQIFCWEISWKQVSELFPRNHKLCTEISLLVSRTGLFLLLFLPEDGNRTGSMISESFWNKFCSSISLLIQPALPFVTTEIFKGILTPEQGIVDALALNIQRPAHWLRWHISKWSEAGTEVWSPCDHG